MWQNLQGEALEATLDMRKRFLLLVEQDPEAFTFLLNYFFKWKGTLSTDSEVALHNAGETFHEFLMGPPVAGICDDRFVEQLLAGLDSTKKDPSKMSGGWRDARR